MTTIISLIQDIAGLVLMGSGSHGPEDPTGIPDIASLHDDRSARMLAAGVFWFLRHNYCIPSRTIINLIGGQFGRILKPEEKKV